MRWGLTFLLVVVAAVSNLEAQVPGVPGVPGVPAAPAAAAASPAAAAANPAAAGGAKNIWSFFCKTPEQKAQCKSQFCSSSIGQFINNLLLPASAISGGLIGPCCPDPATTPNAEDLAKPATGAQGAAAKIKAEEAQAKAKVAAIEYLASVDCRYYPEAEAGMISGLRSEKNECVRLAAAKALASGCCCSAKVVKALTMTVNCSSKDGFPAEASELVRTFAFVALERCLRKCVESDEEPPEQPPAVKQALFESLKPAGSAVVLDREILLAGYFSPILAESNEKIFANARHAIAKGLKVSPATIARLSGPKNVYDSILPNGINGHSTTTSVVQASASEPMAQGPVALAGPPPLTTTEPPTKSAVTLAPSRAAAPAPTMPTVPMPTVPSMYRESRSNGVVPAWLAQRVTAESLPTDTPRMSTPPRSTGRGNLMNIFQDASKR